MSALAQITTRPPERILYAALVCSLLAHAILVGLMNIDRTPPVLKPVVTTYHVDLVPRDAGQELAPLVQAEADETSTNEPKSEESVTESMTERLKVLESKALEQPVAAEPDIAKKEATPSPIAQEKPVKKLSDSKPEALKTEESLETKQHLVEAKGEAPPVKPHEIQESETSQEQNVQEHAVSESARDIDQSETPDQIADNQVVENEEQQEKEQEEKTAQTKPKQEAGALAAQPSIPKYEIGSRSNPRPTYPGLARKRGWQGTVLLGVKVMPNGRAHPKHTIIIESSDYGVFDYAAWETVINEWTFEPAMYAGQAVDGYIEVPITFQLR